MSASDPQWSEALRWVDKAAQDRRSAVLVLADKPPLIDPAAYHCQQAAEKLLKSLLAAAGVTIPKRTCTARQLQSIMATKAAPTH